MCLSPSPVVEKVEFQHQPQRQMRSQHGEEHRQSPAPQLLRSSVAYFISGRVPFRALHVGRLVQYLSQPNTRSCVCGAHLQAEVPLQMADQ